MTAIAAAGANITILTNTVGDVGNAADNNGYGAVNYQYSIGRYEVTNAQYAAFLNAKAASDAYGLYSGDMAGAFGGIVRTGSSGSFSYSTVAGRENWPVNHVDIFDAARFVNWLQNGQANGDTETGTYTLTPGATLMRNPGSTWAITSENEWYKSAYYKGGALNAGYWRYGNASDSITTAMANFDYSVGNLTAVGSYSLASAYGAFDMAGNVWEWNERVVAPTAWGPQYGMRGGSYEVPVSQLGSDHWRYGNFEARFIGFRVVQIPGPSSIALLAIAGLGARGRRRA
jgi:formylglycine-generating enzyme required for sulfatase activity